MLHIILTILKVIGIILLVILGIAVALILLILFWPLCYRGHLVREDGALSADVTAGWLAHLFSAEFHFQEKKGKLKLKIFGKVLKTIDIPRGSSDEGFWLKQEPADKAADKAGPEEECESPQEERKAEEEPASFAAEKKEEKVPPEKKKEKRASRGGKPLKKIPDKIGEAFSKAAEFIRKLTDLIFRAQELPSDIGDTIDAFVSRTEEKIRSSEKKAGPFLTADAFAFYRRALGYLICFLRCCRFRKLEGYLLVGTGEPDTTGQLIGFIYLILPEARGNYDLQADFYEKAFNTDTAFAGHIRLNHALMLAIRLFKDKEFRKLLAHIRHRDGKKQSSRRGSGKRKTDQ